MFTQFIRLEYITIYLLMKRIIIKIQNNINGHYHIFADETYYYKNTEQYQWPLTLFDSHWHAMCVYIKKYVSNFIS